jgi:hypothetical protein
VVVAHRVDLLFERMFAYRASENIGAAGLGTAACPSTPEIRRRPANYAERQKPPTDIYHMLGHSARECIPEANRRFHDGQYPEPAWVPERSTVSGGRILGEKNSW